MPAETPPYWELYDLENDPLEMNNIYPSTESSKVKAELKAQLSELKAQIGDTDEQYPRLMAVKTLHWDQ